MYVDNRIDSFEPKKVNILNSVQQQKGQWEKVRRECLDVLFKSLLTQCHSVWCTAMHTRYNCIKLWQNKTKQNCDKYCNVNDCTDKVNI